MTNTELKLENTLLQLELAVKELELHAVNEFPDIFDVLQCSGYSPNTVINAVIGEYGSEKVAAELNLGEIIRVFEPEEVLDYYNPEEVLESIGEDYIKEYVTDNYYPEDWVEAYNIEYSWR